MVTTILWPQKVRELHHHHFDSTIDLRVPPKAVKLPMVEEQTHRRFLKTHLPVDALRFSPQARYLYIGRDARDVVWSMYNHHVNANQFWYEALNDTPGRVGPPIVPPPADIRTYWREWLERDGHPFWPFWENLRTWWDIRDLPNVKLVHFVDLKRDMPGQIRKIAEFQNATKSVPLGGAFWDAGAEVFINQGVNGRWADTLTEQDSAEYLSRAKAELGEACSVGSIPAKGSTDPAHGMTLGSPSFGPAQRAVNVQGGWRLAATWTCASMSVRLNCPEMLMA